MTEREKVEIKKIKAETKNLISQRIFETIKSVALILGAIIVFIFIQKPESVVNKRLSQETISRERAKLLIDLIKDNNPQRISMGISIIKASYPNSDNQWINEIEKEFQIKSAQIDSLIQKVNELSIKANETKDSLSIEISGNGKIGIPGNGLKNRLLLMELEQINKEIERTKLQIDIHKLK